MVDIQKQQHVSIHKEPEYKSNTIIVDNGIYTLRAGYANIDNLSDNNKNNDLCILVRNRIYKNKEKVSFEPFPLASMKSMFDGDILVNFDILEYSMDMILGLLKPNISSNTDELNLIMTTSPNSPTNAELLDLLFSVYNFNKIQLGYDYIYSYERHFKNKDCLIIAAKHSGIIVSYVENNKIMSTYKVAFGGRELSEYINYIMLDRYKEFRKDYRGLINSIRVSDDYDKEAVDIYNEMCNGIYERNMWLSDAPVNNGGVRNAKKQKRPTVHGTSQSIVLPAVNYQLIAKDDSELGSVEIKEKRKQKMLFYGTMYRLKTKIEKTLKGISEIIENFEEELEKQSDLVKYVEKKKLRFEKLKRELELRHKLRQDSRNRKTREFQIKNKEGVLDAEEQHIRALIADAEDDEQENQLIDKIDTIAAEILVLEPDFIPFYANTVEVLRGDNIGRQCINVELIKWAEIIFEPSIIGSEHMGLSEIIENVMTRFSVKNVLVCGSLSAIKNFGNRIKTIINKFSVDGPVEDFRVESTVDDSFYGATMSQICPIYTREDYEKYGAEELIKSKEICN